MVLAVLALKARERAAVDSGIHLPQAVAVLRKRWERARSTCSDQCCANIVAKSLRLKQSLIQRCSHP